MYCSIKGNTGRHILFTWKWLAPYLQWYLTTWVYSLGGDMRSMRFSKVKYFSVNVCGGCCCTVDTQILISLGCNTGLYQRNFVWRTAVIFSQIANLNLQSLFVCNHYDCIIHVASSISVWICEKWWEENESYMGKT